jgi:hypothetical protein
MFRGTFCICGNVSVITSCKKVPSCLFSCSVQTLIVIHGSWMPSRLATTALAPRGCRPWPAAPVALMPRSELSAMALIDASRLKVLSVRNDGRGVIVVDESVRNEIWKFFFNLLLRRHRNIGKM